MLCIAIALKSQPVTPPTNPTATPQAQEGNRINIESTDVFHFASFGADSLRIRKLLGNVHLSQDTTSLYCDSAYQFIDSNYVEAFSNVRIVMNAHMHDSMQRVITSERLTFDGDTKIINFWGNVVLRDKDVTLRTPRLTYYRIEDYAEYQEGGVVVNDSNTLTSQKGYYYPKTDMAYFRNNVVLVNPEFTLHTDTLGYNTDTKVAFFMAPTTVQDSVNSMYTEDGYYDTESDFVFLTDHSSIGDTTYTMFADTIEYSQERDLGKAKGNVRVEQKDSSLTVFGKYGEFQSKTEASFVTDSAFAVQRFDDDTLYLFADTLSSYKDTVTDKRYFQAYHRASFFMNDLQGICDSLVYWYDDSLMFFYRQPALWSEVSQITGDTIIIQLRDGGIDSMSIPTSPFIITQEDTVGFDQIKGKELHAKFEEKQLKKMWIFGNSESIYYTKDDKDQYLGMNKARCSDMLVDFKENKPSRILFKDKPEGEFFPIHMVLYKKNELDGFVWRAAERPPYPEWVIPKLIALKGIKDSIQLSLDSIMWSLEEVEFEIDDLLNDTLWSKFVDTVASVQPDTAGTTAGTDTMGTAGVDTLNALPDDTLGVAGVDTLNAVPDDTLGVAGVDTLGGPKPGKPDKGAITGLQGQPWEMADQTRDAHGRLVKPKRTREKKGDEPAVADEKDPAKQKDARSLKDRWLKLREDLAAWKKKMKEGPTKAEIAAKEKAKVDKMRKRIDRKAKKDAKKRNRKHKPQTKETRLVESACRHDEKVA